MKIGLQTQTKCPTLRFKKNKGPNLAIPGSPAVAPQGHSPRQPGRNASPHVSQTWPRIARSGHLALAMCFDIMLANRFDFIWSIYVNLATQMSVSFFCHGLDTKSGRHGGYTSFCQHVVDQKTGCVRPNTTSLRKGDQRRCQI